MNYLRAYVSGVTGAFAPVTPSKEISSDWCEVYEFDSVDFDTRHATKRCEEHIAVIQGAKASIQDGTAVVAKTNEELADIGISCSDDLDDQLDRTLQELQQLQVSNPVSIDVLIEDYEQCDCSFNNIDELP